MVAINPFFSSQAAKTSVATLFAAPSTGGPQSPSAVSPANAGIAVSSASETAISAKINDALLKAGRRPGLDQSPPAAGATEARPAATPPEEMSEAIGTVEEEGFERWLAKMNEASRKSLERVLATNPNFLAEQAAAEAKGISFGSAGAAIGMGSEYISRLESAVSSYNSAHTDYSNAIEAHRTKFGDDIAARAEKNFDRYRISTENTLKNTVDYISEIYDVSGALTTTDANGKVSVGQFKLYYSGSNFTASIDSNHNGTIIQNGIVREVSGRELSADLASGKLSPL